MVIECKGEHLAALESEKEKVEVGRLWERKGKGKSLFLCAVKKDDAGRDVAEKLAEKMILERVPHPPSSGLWRDKAVEVGGFFSF